MYKLVALWSAPKPVDKVAFEAAYLNVHVPLARAVPSLSGLETIAIGEGLEGSAPAFYRVAVMICPAAWLMICSGSDDMCNGRNQPCVRLA